MKDPHRLAPLAAVLAGGFVGSAARAGVGEAFHTAPGAFPSATFIVNIVGAFALGLYLARRELAINPRWSLEFWAIGGLGSFTTFSTFSVGVVKLVDAGSTGTAIVYVVASTLLGLTAAILGDRIGSARWAT